MRCPVGSRCLGAGPTRVYGIGWARGVGRLSEKGRVRVSLGPFASPPAPFRGAPVGGGGQGTPGFPLVRPQFCPDPLPQPLARSRGLLELGPRGALRARWSSDQDFIREPSVIGSSDLGKLTPAVASCTPRLPSTPALAQMPAHRMALICAWLGAGLGELGVPRGGGSIGQQVCSSDPRVALTYTPSLCPRR